MKTNTNLKYLATSCLVGPLVKTLFTLVTFVSGVGDLKLNCRQQFQCLVWKIFCFDSNLTSDLLYNVFCFPK